MTNATRIRGRALQTMRRRLFAGNALCAICEASGLVTIATEVDHITALCNGGSNLPDNLQGLCHTCHAAKTAQDTGRRQKPAIGADGWPVGG